MILILSCVLLPALCLAQTIQSWDTVDNFSGYANTSALQGVWWELGAHAWNEDASTTLINRTLNPSGYMSVDINCGISPYYSGLEQIYPTTQNWLGCETLLLDYRKTAGSTESLIVQLFDEWGNSWQSTTFRMSSLTWSTLTIDVRNCPYISHIKKIRLLFSPQDYGHIYIDIDNIRIGLQKNLPSNLYSPASVYRQRTASSGYPLWGTYVYAEGVNEDTANLLPVQSVGKMQIQRTDFMTWAQLEVTKGAYDWNQGKPAAMLTRARRAHASGSEAIIALNISGNIPSFYPQSISDPTTIQAAKNFITEYTNRLKNTIGKTYVIIDFEMQWFNLALAGHSADTWVNWYIQLADQVKATDSSAQVICNAIGSQQQYTWGTGPYGYYYFLTDHNAPTSGYQWLQRAMDHSDILGLDIYSLYNWGSNWNNKSDDQLIATAVHDDIAWFNTNIIRSSGKPIWILENGCSSGTKSSNGAGDASAHVNVYNDELQRATFFHTVMNDIVTNWKDTVKAYMIWEYFDHTTTTGTDLIGNEWGLVQDGAHGFAKKIAVSGTAVDDFNSYTNTAALTTVWTNEQSVLSLTLETVTTVSGTAAMKLQYNLGQSPYYGSGYRTFSPVLDLSAKTHLSLWARGPASLLVQLSSNSGTKVSAVTTITAPGNTWTKYQFDLRNDFYIQNGGGVDLSAVQLMKLFPRDSSYGSGNLYIDEIFAIDTASTTGRASLDEFRDFNQTYSPASTINSENAAGMLASSGVTLDFKDSQHYEFLQLLHYLYAGTTVSMVVNSDTPRNWMVEVNGHWDRSYAPVYNINPGWIISGKNVINLYFPREKFLETLSATDTSIRTTVSQVSLSVPSLSQWTGVENKYWAELE